MLASLDDMAAQLTRDEVERIAELARLSLTPDEASKFARDLTAILEYAADLSTVNTDGVQATTGAGATRWRDDVPAASLSRDEVLAQAPDAALSAGLFRVPKVL